MISGHAGLKAGRAGAAGAAAVGTLVALIAGAACDRRADLPKDPRLETFIRVSAECVYADRAYSADSGLLRTELAEVAFPDDWSRLIDSLVEAHGSSPDLWFQVYSEIAERSRK